MAQTTYKVKAGDTLSEIAEAYVEQSKIPSGYLGTYTSNVAAHGALEAKIRYLLYMNEDITNRDLIYVNQIIVLYGDVAKATTPAPTRATITAFGLQAGTENTIFATWAWSRKYTEKYQVRWMYQIEKDGDWYYGNTGSISIDDNDPAASRHSTYQMPANAIAVSFEVKPISYIKEESDTKNSSDKGVSWWLAEWSTKKTYTDWSNVIPTPSSAPNLEIDEKFKYWLTASLDNVDEDVVKVVQFEVVKNNKTVVYTQKAYPSTGYVYSTFKLEFGNLYKVRCRFGDLYNHFGDWSPYSSNFYTIPVAPSEITECRAKTYSSDTFSIYLTWPAVASATSYDIQHTTNKNAFTSGTTNDDTTTISNISTTNYEAYNFEPGHEYFFRVRAVNDGGASEWSGYKSVALGKRPAAPTTWSSTTTAVVGDPLNLYWVHNSEDGSSATFSQLEVYVNGILTIEEEIKNITEDATKHYSIDTTDYDEGAKLSWRVRTAGVTQELGEWSIMRSVTINAPPTLELTIVDGSGNAINVITQYPFYVRALAGPSTQAPIGYHLSIIANDSYDTVDEVGNTAYVSEGDILYSRYLDVTTELTHTFTPSIVNLVNNQSYTLICTAAMNSGLTSENSIEFTVALDETVEFEPNAEIGIDESSYSAFIRPYCEDLEGNLVTADVYLAVYRRELDGTFTTIAENLYNRKGAFIVDPHPALDYARYRIVATHRENGDCKYFDLPALEVGCKSVVIQWNETWREKFYDAGEGAFVEPIWVGSMLKLPYNIDISESHDVDVSMVEYAGRQHPVTYYGTQLGEGQNWSVVIEKNDIETLTGLRRLAKWAGDVYVREPSGVGYWANVKVSYSRKHLDKTIPVTIEVTRVEGGI